MSRAERVAVVGAETTGAASGSSVTLFNLSENALERGLSGVEKSSARSVKKGGLGADREASLARPASTTDVGKLQRSAVITEAASQLERQWAAKAARAATAATARRLDSVTGQMDTSRRKHFF